MLAIEKRQIDPMIYAYGGIAVTTFASVFGVLYVLFPPDTSRSALYSGTPVNLAESIDSGEVVASYGNDDNENVTEKSNSKESTSSWAPTSNSNTSAPAAQGKVTKPAQTSDVASSQTAAEPSSSVPVSSEDASATAIEAEPTPSANTTTPSETSSTTDAEDSSLLGGLLNPVGELVDSLM